MEAEKEVSIKETNVQLTIFIPRLGHLSPAQNDDLAWKFMRKYGEDFAELRKMYPNVVRPVDGYVNHAEGWDIIVTVPENRLELLYSIIAQFCVSEGLFFNHPENEK